MQTTNSTLLTAASQLAAALAQQSGPGFSKNPSDYALPWVKISGGEFNSADPKFRPEIPKDGFLIGNNVINPAGAQVIVLGMKSGFDEVDRVIVKGVERKRRYAIWKSKPNALPVTGKGGGLKTDRGGWLSGQFDEIFMLTAYGAAVVTLFDQHNVVADLNQAADSLGIGAMFEAKWTLTRKVVSDSHGYEHAAPHFELLGVDGEDDGPTKAEMTRAKKLSNLIERISYPLPGIPLMLVANGPIGEPPPDRAPPIISESDYDGGRPDLDDDMPF